MLVISAMRVAPSYKYAFAMSASAEMPPLFTFTVVTDTSPSVPAVKFAVSIEACACAPSPPVPVESATTVPATAVLDANDTDKPVPVGTDTGCCEASVYISRSLLFTCAIWFHEYPAARNSASLVIQDFVPTSPFGAKTYTLGSFSPRTNADV